MVRYVFALLLVLSLGCTSPGDVCSALPGDLAGTYELKIYREQLCFCGTAMQPISCSEACPDFASSDCSGMQCSRQAVREEVLIKVADDGSLLVGSDDNGAFKEELESPHCQPAEGNLCDLTVNCSEKGNTKFSPITLRRIE